MSRKIAFLMLLLISMGVFAEEGVAGKFKIPGPTDKIIIPVERPKPLSYENRDFAFIALRILAAAADSESAPVIPADIRNNQFYLESIRLTRLAQETFDYGDYDASAEYAAEAVRYALLSDEYVALQLKIKETNDTIAAARTRLDWAVSVNARTRYPTEFGRAQNFYDTAISERSSEHWDNAIDAARRVMIALADVQSLPEATPVQAPVQQAPVQQVPVQQAPAPRTDNALPAQYTVRPWATARDCFWNIAGRSWAYGDSSKWRLLYDANRSRLPEPNNPDLIHPGMVLDIPSIGSEARQGLWDQSKTYPSR
jgi:hypothetical protein